jgi:hypothetical protein
MEKKITYMYNGHEYDSETKNLKYFRKAIPMCCGTYTEGEIRKLKNNVNSAIDWLAGIQQAEIGHQGVDVSKTQLELEKSQLNELVRSIVYALGCEDILKDK